jgi:hypothetical protein
VRHLGDGVRDNPLLLVEALFQHPFPHHWCQHLLHAYVSAQHLTSIARAKHDDSADYEVSHNHTHTTHRPLTLECYTCLPPQARASPPCLPLTLHCPVLCPPVSAGRR